MPEFSYFRYPLKLCNYVIEEADILHKNNNLQYPQDQFLFIFFTIVVISTQMTATFFLYT